MGDTLTLRILTTERPVDGAVALARGGGFLPGLDMVVLPAGLDADHVNALLGALPPGDGEPVTAQRDQPAAGVRAGDLGMIQASGDGALSVLVGETAVPFDGRDFGPAWAMTYLRLQGYAGRFRHVIAASGPSADLRYAAVAARAATAALTVLGTPDQVFRMVGPRDARGVPVSREFRIAVGGGGRRLIRVVEEGGAVLADLPLAPE